jgi:small acid-soluble spore protein H (minor)
MNNIQKNANSSNVFFCEEWAKSMNVGRAKEILESADMIHVTYNGTPVIIQHVDEKTKMARIYSRKDPDNEQDVPVLNLIED